MLHSHEYQHGMLYTYNFHYTCILQLRNQFASAGVNQTHHQVMLDIQTHVLFITPDSYEPTEVNTSICIAETVIVGEVPQAYAGITTGEITQK